MPNYNSVVSPAELCAANIRLRHADAVAIAREVALRVSRGELSGVPAPQSLRLGSDGSITVDGEAPAGRELERAACLLEVLIADAVAEVAAPAAFRLIVARAYAKDEAAFASLDRFAEALAPFSSPDVSEAVRSVVESWMDACGHSTIEQLPPPAVEHDSGVSDELNTPISDDHDASGPGEQDARGEDDEAEPRPAATPIVSISPRTTRVKPRSWVAIPAPHSPAEDDAWMRVQEFLMVNFDTEDTAAASVTLRPAPDRRRSIAALPDTAPMAEPTHRRAPVSPRQAIWAAALALAAMLVVGVISRSRPAHQTTAEPGPIASVSPAAPAATAAPVDGGAKNAPPAEAAAPADETTAPVPAVSAAVPAAPSPDPRMKRRTGTVGRFTPSRVDVTRSASSNVAATNVLPTAAYSPAFASATSAMFYHSGTGPESNIMRADTDRSGAVLRVTSVVGDRGSNFHPRPSPDGKLIAFDSDRDGERGIYVADAEGRGVRRVSGPGFAAVPSWSPDGRQLAFVRSEPGRPKVWNIWTVDLASGASTRLTSHPYGQPWGASWFPDGNRIAYSHEDRLIVRSLSGGAVRTFNSPVRGRLVRTPAISPDGQRIIFQVRHDGAWLLDLSNDSMRRVLEDPSAEEFTWSPDGRRVAYHSRRSGSWGVWIMAPR